MNRFITTLLFAIFFAAVPATASPLTDWIGSIALKRGDSTRAETFFKKGTSAEAHYNLGHIFLQQKRFEDAAAQFKAATQVTDSKEIASKAFYNLGNCRFHQDKLSEALESYKEALKRNPRDEDARYNLSVVLDKLENQKQEDDEQSQEEQKENDESSQAGQSQDEQEKSDESSQDGQSQDDQKKNDESSQDGQSQEEQEKKDESSQAGQSQEEQEKKDESSQAGQIQDETEVAKEESSGQQGEVASPQLLSPEEAKKQEARDLLRYFEQKERRESRRRSQKTPRFYTKGAQSW